MTNVVETMVVVLVSCFVPFIFGSIHHLSLIPLLPLFSNTFSFGIPSIGMLNVSTSSHLIPQIINFAEGSSLTPLQVFPWGGGHIPSSIPYVRSGSLLYSYPNPFVVWVYTMGREFQSSGMPSNSNPFHLFWWV
jgi:hypothetical protein